MRIKVYNPEKVHLASFKYFEDAASFVAVLGNDATIRTSSSSKSILWTEGKEEFNASESYDQVADICRDRYHQRIKIEG